MYKFGFIAFLLCLHFVAGFAQPGPSISEKTRGMQRIGGFMPFYADREQGKIWLEIKSFDEEFLYVHSLPAGLGSNDIGLDRGLLGGSRVVSFQMTGKKVLLVESNQGYRAVNGSVTEKRAVAQSFASSVLWGFTVEAAADGSVLVDATDFVTRDAIQAAQQIRRSGQGNYSADKSRSAVYFPGCKSFPDNTELEGTVTLTNSDGIVGSYIQDVVPSVEAITLRMHHSFVKLPGPGFDLRPFDPRSGYFAIGFFDYSTPVSEPIQKYYAARHRLHKKDPSAARSEPVKPIVYYLDPGTPEPIRSALLDGARWWNQAFEAIGYVNAFRVEILPDSVDPMDVRYNVINWVHRSTRGWSYGASVTDPRTGEIIKGQVTLGSLRVRQDYLIAQGLMSPFGNEKPGPDPMLELSLARLRQLSAHEVGHTLGIMHNYASSVNNRASVMDYPHPLVQPGADGRLDFSKSYATGIGAWDIEAIRWGYSHFPPGTEQPRALDEILRAATAKGLLYISDRDARAAGGMHPKAHLWDNGPEAINELKNVAAVRKKALQQFGQNSIRTGVPMAMLEDVLVPVYFYHRYQAEAVAKLIGGVDYSYNLKGDGQAGPTQLSKKAQQEALAALMTCLQPEFLRLPDTIAQLIPPRPAGYEYTRELFTRRTSPSFDQLAPAETAADFVIALLFHPDRMNRLVQQELQGGLGPSELIDQLLATSWKAPAGNGISRLIQYQTQQVLLTYLMAGTVDDRYAYTTKAAIRQKLDQLKTWLETQGKTTRDSVWAGQISLALERLKQPEKALPVRHAVIPPGAPIGCIQEMLDVDHTTQPSDAAQNK